MLIPSNFARCCKFQDINAMQEVMAPFVYLKWFVKIQVITRAKWVAGLSGWKAVKLQNDVLNNKYKFMRPYDKLS